MSGAAAVREAPTGSYLGRGLRKAENRIAAVVAAIAALAVLGISRTPLPVGPTYDLREADVHGLVQQVTVTGFGAPEDVGRKLLAPEGRLVWNRPLPGRFALSLRGRASGGHRVEAEVRMGDARHRVAFPAAGSQAEIALVNPDGAREVRIHAPKPGPSLILEQVALR